MYQGLVQAFHLRAIEQPCWIDHGTPCRTVRQTLVCPASNVQVAMFRIDHKAWKNGRLCPEWTIVEEKWATASVELNRYRQTTS